MKKLLSTFIVIVLGISSCQKTVHELPKTNFTSAKQFAESLLPELVVIETNTDSAIEIVFQQASVKVYRYDWSFEDRSKPVRIKARYYDRAIEMMCGSLPTVSDGELLSSEGSFELKFEIEGQSVTPKRIRTRFETDGGFNPSMTLFNGVQTESGFNWVEIDTLPQVSNNIPAGYLSVTEGETSLAFAGVLYPASSFLGPNNGTTFINCDDFPSVPTQRTHIEFDIQNLPGSVSGDIVAGLYFEDLNGFLTVRPPDSEEMLPSVINVPTALQCKAIVIAVSDETIYYCIEDIVTELDQRVLLNLEPIDEAELSGKLTIL